MSIKSIVVHLADDPYGLDRLRLAHSLAERFETHLDAVYTSTRVVIPAPAVGRAASMAYIEVMAEEAKAHVNDLLAETEKTCADLPSWQWQMGTSNVEDAVARYAHLADLVIVEQPTREMEERTTSIPLADYVYIAQGSPLLVVPPH